MVVGSRAIGVFIILPVVKLELAKFLMFVKRVDSGEDLDTAHARVESQKP